MLSNPRKTSEFPSDDSHNEESDTLTNSDGLPNKLNNTFGFSKGTNSKDKEYRALSIENSSSKSSKSHSYFEKEFMSYNIICLMMILVSSIAEAIAISTLMENPDEENIFTMAFVAYIALYMIIAGIAVYNTKRRIYARQKMLIWMFWALLLAGSWVNIELLRNFPEKEHHYYHACTLLALLYITVTMFLVSRAKKLANKMLRQEYLSVSLS